MTSRSIDLALRKYQQWSSKFLPATSNSNSTMPMQAPVPATVTTPTMPVVATNADCVTTHLSTSSSHKSNSCSYSANTTTATSGYYSRLTTMIGNASEVERSLEMGEEEEKGQQQLWSADGDRELLVSANKRPKVYDCMKEFLCRKLFQQRHGQQEQQQRRQQQQQSALLEAAHCKSDTEEDVTSDYDEVDMLDSSYNADEEDASDCSSQCTCPLESDNEDMEARRKVSLIEQQPQQAKQPQQQRSTPQKSISPQKSMLSLNCWQNSTQYTDSTTSTEAEEEEEEEEATNAQLANKVADYQNIADDSDAGISDCCQLISEKSSPSKQRVRQPKPKQKQQSQARYNRNNNADDDEELLASNWYQPRITTKAALERLQQATPGTFLLRRKSRSYELCLRAETKVKQFAVVALADNHYKLKGAKKQFTSLKALVTHHSVMAEELPLTLALPRVYSNSGHNNRAYGVSGKCAKNMAAALEVSAQTWRSLRYADDFDTYESLQILGLLQDWQSETNEF
ncbi:PREDICTED: uncharacterized protein LOC108381324 [Rhagoletis zephyria]|uniref:uncharacterized protein LOC108381324 n=1 Tax=Rhagoletis zephyria TaxID=28612 RepID=UPI0008119EC0|nr:PREDICTED: uncharacterized protein LOC108381324 [Rhagoletis zephyria]